MSETETAPNQGSSTVPMDGNPIPDQPSWDIAPEDQKIADEIAGFHPVQDVPSPIVFEGGKDTPITPGLPALPPEVRLEIQNKLSDASPARRDDLKQELIAKYLEQQGLNTRILCGPGSGSNPYQKEMMLQSRQMDHYQRESLRLHEELAAVSSWVPEFDEAGERVYDEETGQQKLKPIMAVQGEQRKGLENQLLWIERGIDDLNGFGGQRRRKRALFEAVQAHKSQQAQIEEAREARELGAAMAREARIKAAAESFAKGQKSAL